MAIQVPVYRSQQVQQSAVPNVRQQIDTPDAAFGSLEAQQLQQSGTALARLGDQWNKKAINIQDEVNELATLDYQTQIEGELTDYLYNPEGGLLTKKGKNALDAPRMMQQKIGDIKKRYDGMTGVAPDVRQMLNKSFLKMNDRYTDLARRHQLQEYTTFKSETLDAKMSGNMQDIALNYMDDKEFQAKADENFKILQSKATSDGWSDEKLNAEKRKAYAGMRGTQIQAMISTDDPEKIILAKQVYDESRKRGQMDDFEISMKIENQLQAAVPKAAAFMAYKNGRAAPAGQDNIINFIIDEQEGGSTIANEPRGAIAKFGINSEANPDIDVKNLDRTGAVAEYKTRYWDAAKIDDLPENMRLIAMDTVVNHGVTRGKKLIEAAKGDPSALLNIRMKEYQRLAEANPAEYGEYTAGWRNRLQKLAGTINGAVDAKTVYSAAAELDKQYKGAGAELIALYDNDQKQKAALKTAEKNDVADQVQQIVSENNGDWTKVPSTLRAAAAEHGIDITAYKGQSDPDVVASLDAMPTAQFEAINLSDPQYAQALTYADKQKFVAKQNDLQKPENKYTSEMVDGIVNYYFKSQQGADPEAKGNKAKVAAMKNYVMYKSEEYFKAGKKPSKEDLTKFASEYLTLFKEAGSIYGTNDVKLTDISAPLRATIEQGLLKAGRAPTETSVLTAYVKMKQAGLIADE